MGTSVNMVKNSMGGFHSTNFDICYYDDESKSRELENLISEMMDDLYIPDNKKKKVFRRVKKKYMKLEGFDEVDLFNDIQRSVNS